MISKPLSPAQREELLDLLARMVTHSAASPAMAAARMDIRRLGQWKITADGVPDGQTTEDVYRQLIATALGFGPDQEPGPVPTELELSEGDGFAILWAGQEVALTVDGLYDVDLEGVSCEADKVRLTLHRATPDEMAEWETDRPWPGKPEVPALEPPDYFDPATGRNSHDDWS